MPQPAIGEQFPGRSGAGRGVEPTQGSGVSASQSETSGLRGPKSGEGGTGQTTEEEGASQSILSGPWQRTVCPDKVRDCCKSATLRQKSRRRKEYCSRAGEDFPAGPAAKTLLPVQGPRPDRWSGKLPRAEGPLSPRPTSAEPEFWSPRATTAEGHVPRASALRQERPPR